MRKHTLYAMILLGSTFSVSAADGENHRSLWLDGGGCKVRVELTGKSKHSPYGTLIYGKVEVQGGKVGGKFRLNNLGLKIGNFRSEKVYVDSIASVNIIDGVAIKNSEFSVLAYWAFKEAIGVGPSLESDVFLIGNNANICD